MTKAPQVALLLTLGLMVAVLLNGFESDLTPVFAPVLALLVLGIAVYVLTARPDGIAPMELGIMYVVVVLIYGLYPLVAYLILGGLYTPLNDSRLFGAQPDPETVGRLGWYYAIYLASFTAAYLLARRAADNANFNVPRRCDYATLLALATSVVTLRVGLLLADVLFSERTADDYLATYTRFQYLPLLARQLLSHAAGISLFLQVGLIVVLAQQWARFRWIVFAWIAFEFVVLASGLGARTEFFVLVLATLLARHLLFRPLRTATVTAAGAALFTLFAVFGVIRALGALTAGDGGLIGVGTASEFDSLFGNAYDIDRMVASGELDRAGISGLIYFGDFLALIPQQLLGTEKFSLATWYVTTYYPEYADQGGGLAFGAIAESIAGAGIVDLIWRGAAIGIIFGSVQRYVTARALTVWHAAMYVWLVCFSYQSFRASTFALLPTMFFRVLPAIALVAVLAALVRAASSPHADNPTQRAERDRA